MIRGHIIELNPNNVQPNYFARACGVARFSYNWALVEWQRQYRADKIYRDSYLSAGVDIDPAKLNKPSQAPLRRQIVESVITRHTIHQATQQDGTRLDVMYIDSDNDALLINYQDGHIIQGNFFGWVQTFFWQSITFYQKDRY